MESFVTKAGPLYVTITNLLTMADLNFKENVPRIARTCAALNIPCLTWQERLRLALANWQGRHHLWQIEKAKVKHRQEARVMQLTPNPTRFALTFKPHLQATLAKRKKVFGIAKAMSTGRPKLPPRSYLSVYLTYKSSICMCHVSDTAMWHMLNP